jgi:hypothetical protein
MSPAGRKLRSFFVKIDEISRFASCWARFYAYRSVHYVLRVKCSDLALKRRNIADGKILTDTFCQNRRNIAFCEELGLIRRVIQRALFSARNM